MVRSRLPTLCVQTYGTPLPVLLCTHSDRVSRVKSVGFVAFSTQSGFFTSVTLSQQARRAGKHMSYVCRYMYRVKTQSVGFHASFTVPKVYKRN